MLTRRVVLTAGMLLAGLALAAPGQSRETVLRLWLTGPIAETPTPGFSLETLLGAPQPRSLFDWTQLLHRAAESSRIDGVVMIIDGPELGLAQGYELQRAMRAVRAAGKPVHVFMNAADNVTYLVAAAADEIMLAEHSLVEITGLEAVQLFYRGLMEKVGVEADLIPIGDYKTAAEPFLRSGPSEENQQQTNRLLDRLYEAFVANLAEQRELTPAAVEAAINAAPLSSADAFERKLVDRIGNYDDFRQLLFKRFGEDVQVVKQLDAMPELDVDLENPMGFFDLWQNLQEAFKGTKRGTQPAVAVIFVEGVLMPTLSEPPIFGSPIAGSTTIRAALQAALEDDAIEAVVLRIDSPGGSALASDIIWNAAQAVSEKKPVIVSMGNVAGSGGYYVAAAGDVILTEPTTLTGSIGVFGGKLVWGGLLEDKLGIAVHTYTRGDNAGLLNPMDPFTEEERTTVRAMLERVYRQFKERVAATRAPELAQPLEELAGGRVYTGQEAVELGLADRIGGLHEAIALAAQRAGISDPNPVVLPREPELGELLAMALFGGKPSDEYDIRLPQTRISTVLNRSAWPAELRALAPRELGLVQRALRELAILSQERLGLFMSGPALVR